MTTTTITRSRVPVWAAAALLTVLPLVSLGGAVYFTFVYEGGVALAAGLPFVAVFAAVSATGVASGVGLVRGLPLAWRAAVAYVVVMTLWTIAKLVVWHETEAVVFGVAALAIGALLLAPATRRHVAGPDR
jgi:hypothetical protein